MLRIDLFHAMGQARIVEDLEFEKLAVLTVDDPISLRLVNGSYGGILVLLLRLFLREGGGYVY